MTRMLQQKILRVALGGFLTWGLAWGLQSCGNMEPQTGENYGNLLTTASGLTLTQGEHQAGWGKTDCSECHNFNNIHLVDRTGTGINMTTIRNTTFTNGNSSCATCHGTNGVP